MISINKINSILNDPSRERLEELAAEASRLTRQYFGRAIGLYTPLYLSNYCASHCVYCGFHSHNKIDRIKLSCEDIKAELQAIARTGVRNILLLTGESPQATPLEYLAKAVTLAKEHFQGIALEIYPLSEPEYHALYLAGADGITLYQETYDPLRYGEVHLAGQKKDYAFRRDAPARIARAGMRQISLGILLGLGPLAADLAALYAHLRELEIEFPGVEYSLSFPRLRTIKARSFAGTPIDDITFVKILCLTRTLFPRVGINLSTRESAAFRNRALELSITKISVGSRTTVGGYNESDEKSVPAAPAGLSRSGTPRPTLPRPRLAIGSPGGQGTKDKNPCLLGSARNLAAPQFDISDERSAAETILYLKEHGFDPVFTDWRRITNT
ncbi:MAG: radical SAM protein [Candidatus Omnitrophica bacterium]|nr:radical SAM protein [Candidatus Omnitrophota bacterium]